jgi:M6 family metalloprotease-like protein
VCVAWAAMLRAADRPAAGLLPRRTATAFPVVLLFVCLGMLVPDGAAAQSARMPAAWPGVAPPAEIAGLNDVRPLIPLEFSRAWLRKVEEVRLRRAEVHAAGELDGMSPEDAAERGAALSGVLRVPVIPVRYADVAEPFGIDQIERRLFGPNQGDTMSFAGYWDEVSGGLLRVEGEVTPWITLDKPASYYLPARQAGWGEFGRIAEIRDEALRAADRYLDFRRFDNDGSDGVPNSGDDDGYVDFVAILYALPCRGDQRSGAIWPHRAAMPAFESRDRGVDGEPIRITDYVIIPIVDPVTCGPAHIGLLAHETGHALGLPDLYDYDGSSQGIGSWGLMGTGSHNAPHSPAHLGAWEKEQLGWVRVAWLKHDDPDFVIEPVKRSRTIHRYDSPDRTGEYVLLENRQKIGSDRRLPGSGLLAWHVDPERGELGAWNNDERRAAVSIIDADGKNKLARGQRADAGDPFPGAARRTFFLSSLAHDLFLYAIEEQRDGSITARLRVGYSPPGISARPRVVRLSGVAGGGEVRQSVDVQRIGGADFEWTARPARRWLDVHGDDDVLQLRADPTGLAAGEHADTVRFYDDAGNMAGELYVSFYVAVPGVGQIVATELPWSWGLAARDGRIFKASYGWDPLGLRPRPRVLELREGDTHPLTRIRLPADALYAPLLADDGTGFVLARAGGQNFVYRLDADGSAAVVAARFGSSPAYGATLLPDGDMLVAEWDGRIHRVSAAGNVHLWAQLDARIYQIASDARGTVYAASYSGDVIRVRADGSLSYLATGFSRGRLVAVAATPEGDVYAAERGGEGRIIRFHRNGGREVIFRERGAQYYGIAVEESFLYALDLGQRKLLRIPLPQREPATRLVEAAPEES